MVEWISPRSGRRHLAHGEAFGWQAGYAAFSVSKSQAEQVKRYIANQEKPHQRMGFQEELLAFLKRHGVEYDPRYVCA